MGELGRPASRSSEEEEKLYSYAYALAAADYCPDLALATDHFPSNYNWDRMNTFEPGSPLAEVERDHRDLPTFCLDVLRAFGNKGRAIPHLFRPAPPDVKTITGTPKILRGLFADRPEQCPYWTGDEGFRIEFGSESYNTCGGQVCDRHIVSHAKTRDGFVLNVRHWLAKGKGSTGPERIKVIDKDTIVYLAPNPTTLHRCPE